ncbi:MAG: SagB/ThcOx family dehydrogenase [Gammaproteobacteria bacterium]|nr:SagB/ThcOx family dehydrogenase [Gammaproteobacteria bacterium]
MRAFLPCLVLLSLGVSSVASGDDDNQRIALPRAATAGEMPVEQALAQRRSAREFARGGLSLEDVGQLLWAAQGVTHKKGYRTAPSAGALYPLEVYLVVGKVDALSPGVYHYSSKYHDLFGVASGDRRRALAAAALGQDWVRRAPAVLVIAGVYERSSKKYGGRAQRYTRIETGHVAQNVYLQATALGLGTVLVGAFHDAEVQEALDLPADHEPLGLMPIGRVR